MQDRMEAGENPGDAGTAASGVLRRGTHWRAVARLMSGGLLALQVVMTVALAWALNRLGEMRCGPEIPGVAPPSHAPLAVATLGVQLIAVAVAATLLRRARSRATTLAALAALLAAALGALVSAGALVYVLLLALGC
jgi:hypothetical protein